MLYGFVDASRQGFRSSFATPNGMLYTLGMWGADDQSQSSNYRELNNLVTTLERHVSDGTLGQSEVYVFMDNGTAEAMYCKGNSSSRLLFELILCLQMLEMMGGLLLNVIHVTDKQMVEEGTSGLSQGEL